MTLPMLEILRTEAVRIRLELFRRGGEAGDEHMPILRRGSTYYPAPYEFVYLRMCVANLSRKLTPHFLASPIVCADEKTGGLRVLVQPLVLTVDVVVDPSDHAIQEGAPSGTPVGRLESGAERELETPLCFIACGQFHVHVTTRSIDATAREAKVGFATLKVVVRDSNPP
jgi:hypothetical protein